MIGTDSQNPDQDGPDYPIGNSAQNPDGYDFETRVECPNCRELVEPEELIHWDTGRDQENGYHDTGTGCVCCILSPMPQNY